VKDERPGREQVEVLRYVDGHDGWVPLLRLILAEYGMLDVSSCVRFEWLEYDDDERAVRLTDLGREVLEHPVSGPDPV